MNHFESQDNARKIVTGDDVVQFEDLDAPDIRRPRKWQQYLQRLFTRKLRRYWFIGGIVASLACLFIVLMPSLPFLHNNPSSKILSDAYTYSENRSLSSVSFVQAVTPQYIYIDYQVPKGKNEIRALRRSNGAKVWSYQVYAPIVNQLMVAGDMLYTNIYDGHINSLYALNALTGALLWKYALPASFTSLTSFPSFFIFITVASRIVYDISSQGDVIALQSQTGKQLWLYQKSAKYVINDMEFKIVGNIIYLSFMREEQFVVIEALSGSLLWSNDKYFSFFAARSGIVYVSDQQSSLYAFQSRTGKNIWKSPTPLIQGQYAIVADDLIVSAQADGSVEAFHIKTSRVAWRSKSLGLPATILRMINNHLYIVNSNTPQNWALVSLDPSNGSLLWRFSGSVFTQVEGSGNYVYVKDVNDQISVLLAGTGKLLWNSSLGASLNDDSGDANGGLADPTFQIMNNRVFITTLGQNNNTLTVMNNNTGSTLWQRASIIGMPALFANTVYITGADGALYAYEGNSGRQIWSAQQ